MMDALSHYLAVSTVETLRVILPGVGYDIVGPCDVPAYDGFGICVADVCSVMKNRDRRESVDWLIMMSRENQML